MFGSGIFGDLAVVIRRNPKTCERSMDELVWGVFQSGDIASRPLHARAETVVTLPIGLVDRFCRQEFPGRRCIATETRVPSS